MRMYVCIVHACDVEHLESRKHRFFAESQSSITVQALWACGYLMLAAR